MSNNNKNKKVIIGIVTFTVLFIGGWLTYKYLYKRNKASKPKTEPDIKEEKVIRKAYDNLVFDFGKDTIKPFSLPALDELAKVMSENPVLTLKLEGHTDNVGDAASNLALSKKRAESVKKYLISKGISYDRITADGFGMTKPIVPNDSDENREKNRRVEFILS